MTPEEARKLLDGITPAPWEVGSWNKQEVDCPEVTEFWITGHNNIEVAVQETIERHRDETESDFSLMAAAPDMAAIIAGMTTEYAVQIPNGELVGVSWSSYGSYETAREHRDAWRRDGYDANIVCRYVTAPQPLGENQ